MKRFVTLAAAALITACLAQSAAAQVTLQNKVADGKTSKATVKNSVKQTLSIGDMSFDTGQEQTIVAKSVAGQRQSDGTIKVAGEIESFKAKSSLPGGIELDFDSANPPAPQGTQFDVLLDVFEAVAKIKTTTTFDRENDVVAVEVDKEFLDGLDESVKALIGDQIEAQALKTTEQQQRDQIPDKPVKPGDTWERTIVAPLGGGQTFTLKNVYKYDGETEKDGQKLHAISYQSKEVSYSLNNPNAPLQVSASDLKVDSSDGKILFDNERGAIVQQSDKLHITGDMTFAVGGNDLPGKLDLTIDNSTTFE